MTSFRYSNACRCNAGGNHETQFALLAGRDLCLRGLWACGHMLQMLTARVAAALDQIDTDVLAFSMAQELDIDGDGKVGIFALPFRCVRIFYVMVHAEFQVHVVCSIYLVSLLAWQIMLSPPESAVSDG